MLGTSSARQARNRRVTRISLLASASGLAALAGLLTQFYRWGLHGIPYPFEDAAMLFRYAEVLAHGGGIAFNPGEDPGVSDGATDLGFVLLLAPLIAAGLKPTTASFALNALAIIVMGALLALLNHRLWLMPWWVPPTIAFGLGLTVASPVAGGFSSAILGATLLAVFVWATSLLESSASMKPSRSRFLALGAFAGLCGWWRPDGFLLALVVLLGAALVVSHGRVIGLLRSRYAAMTYMTVGFVATVLLWMAFRVTYFGQLIPTSGVNKISSLSLANVDKALYFYLVSLAWLWLIFVIACLLTGRKRSLFTLVTIFLVSSAIWIPLDLTFNWWGRVYWPLLPFLAASAVALMPQPQALDPQRTPSRTLFTGLSLALAAITLVLLTPEPYGRYFNAPFQQAVYGAIRDIDTSGVRVATTEAGLIPLAVDEGRALDTYVHNTRAIAEFGDEALRSELDRFSPNLIVIHGYPPAGAATDRVCVSGPPSPWDIQTATLFEYATRLDFVTLQAYQVDECEVWVILGNDALPSTTRTALQRMQDPFDQHSP